MSVLAYVEVSAEEDDEPQEGGEQRFGHVLEQGGGDVVVDPGHVEADQDVDQEQEATYAIARHLSRSYRRGAAPRLPFCVPGKRILWIAWCASELMSIRTIPPPTRPNATRRSCSS